MRKFILKIRIALINSSIAAWKKEYNRSNDSQRAVIAIEQENRAWHLQNLKDRYDTI